MPESTLKTGQQILEQMGGYRAACVLGAAAELDVWNVLGDEKLSAEVLTKKLKSDERATPMLLDALAALGVLEKDGTLYATPENLRPLLIGDSQQTILPMILHQMNLLRSWSQLAWVTKTGVPALRQASICGADADRVAFIGAMHSVSRMFADELVAKLGPFSFKNLLDVGGASGTWTIAFLRAVPGTRATIYDLPDAVKQAKERLKKSEVAGRVSLISGDFYTDRLPSGYDFAWVSAIAHQHSRRQNCELFAKIFDALEPGGHIGIRDVVMDKCRTRPVEGALFAINMLVNTENGGTFTYDEFAEDLKTAGFVNPQFLVRHDSMNSVIIAEKAG